ncbi:hypothetical protein PoB_005587300 [Plakobranchus ocellatus]|uniref:Uncharacterized protein n=1 Tax=Plakobranchus ocellatus TaxID=259542 RepID=A0AAV4CEI2_9GAST|nr:hypothetical protein PoB_005587300 [Plakobranchus ocellatus]
MESLEVISKVTQPTDWVNSLAFSREQNGKLRVCLDPKDLNKAIKRTYHKTPTLEEILHNAQVKYCTMLRCKVLLKDGCPTWLLGYTP